MDRNSKFTIPKTVVARAVGSDVVILDLEGGTYYGLDEVGKRIWDLFAEGKTIAETCDVLLAEYDTDAATLSKDTESLAGALLERKLISL